jgi:glycosyltransferase involved in cell wall biosynthesis
LNDLYGHHSSDASAEETAAAEPIAPAANPPAERDWAGESEIQCETALTVTILTHSYLDAYTQNITRPFGGGLERYVHALCRTILAMGLRPIVHQLSYYGAFDTIHEGVQVRGFTYNMEQVGPAFEEMAAAAEGLVIYGSCIWHPIRYRPFSIGICHGISWDRHDMPLQDKQTIAATIQSAVNQLDRLVSVDSQFLTYCRSVCHYDDAGRIILLPNAVNTELFTPVTCNAGGHGAGVDSGHGAGVGGNHGQLQQQEAAALRVLFPRRLSFERGIVPMMLAADCILNEFPAVVVEFAGELVDNTTLAIAFRAWHQTHPHKERIEQRTYSFEQVREAYRRADIAVIPTIFSEGTSLACLEAMSCGIPVISSNVGGLNDIVIDGLNGLLVAPRAAALIEAIRILLRDEPQRRAMGTAARQTALAFDERKWQAGWTAIIREQLRRINGG